MVSLYIGLRLLGVLFTLLFIIGMVFFPRQTSDVIGKTTLFLFKFWEKRWRK